MSQPTCDCRLHHLAHVECLRILMGEHVEQLCWVRGLVRFSQVLVALVQLSPDVVQRDALVPETLSTPVSTLLTTVSAVVI